jgi:hypothetical protein
MLLEGGRHRYGLVVESYICAERKQIVDLCISSGRGNDREPGLQRRSESTTNARKFIQPFVFAKLNDHATRGSLSAVQIEKH